MTIHTWEYSTIAGGATVSFTVAYDDSLTEDNITITVTEGKLEINALWFSDGDDDAAEFCSIDPEPGLNMNGTGIIWDGHQFINGAGLEGDLTYFLDATDLDTENDSLLLTADDCFLDWWANFENGDGEAILGVRATSVNDGGSIKLVDDEPDDHDPGQEPEDICWNGFTLGYWKTHQSLWDDAGDNGDFITTSIYEDQLINEPSSSSWFLNNKTFINVLDMSGKGLTSDQQHELSLAKQGVAALVNSDQGGYAFTVDDIKAALDFIYANGFTADADGDSIQDWEELQHVLDFYNHGESNNPNWDADEGKVCLDPNDSHALDSLMGEGTLPSFLDVYDANNTWATDWFNV